MRSRVVTPQEAGECWERLIDAAARLLAREIAGTKRSGLELSSEGQILLQALEWQFELRERLAIQHMEESGDDLGKSLLELIVKNHSSDA